MLQWLTTLIYDLECIGGDSNDPQIGTRGTTGRNQRANEELGSMVEMLGDLSYQIQQAMASWCDLAWVQASWKEWKEWNWMEAACNHLCSWFVPQWTEWQPWQWYALGFGHCLLVFGFLAIWCAVEDQSWQHNSGWQRHREQDWSGQWDGPDDWSSSGWRQAPWQEQETRKGAKDDFFADTRNHENFLCYRGGTQW